MFRIESEFFKIFERLLESEGGFQKNSKDRGNWTGGVIGKGELKGTKYGISAMSYPDVDIENLTKEHAMEIYFNDFYKPFKSELNIPDYFTFQFFDSSIHHGTYRTVVFLQRALNVKPDGIFGMVTSKALEFSEPNKVLLLFLAERLDFMNDLSNWNAFSRGWSQRIVSNLRYAAND